MGVMMGVLMAMACLPAWAAETGEKPIKAVLVTGGHGFDEKAVLSFFEGLEGIDVVHAHQRDHSEVFEDVAQWPYDVIVFYHMTAEISAKRQRNFIKLLEKGVGVVALHHAVGAFPDWPEYAKIIGVKYYLKPEVRDGVERPRCTYEHDIDFTIHVEDAGHAVTRGLTDFQVHDETYKGCDFEADNHVLLTSDHATSDKTVGWVRTYANAKICTIQMGHGPQVFGQEAYRRLVTQAIRFCAREGDTP